MHSQEMSAPRTAIIVVVTFLVGFVVLSTLVMESHPVSLRQLSQVRLGATAADVEGLIGEPETIQRSSSGAGWVYGGYWWCTVTVQ
jgi:hypothetical protein